MNFRVYEFEVVVNNRIFSGNEQREVHFTLANAKRLCSSTGEPLPAKS